MKELKPHYAVMINGEWGSGKTYYLKNIIFSELKQLGYQPVYISLYGIGSTNELRERILNALTPYSKSFVYKLCTRQLYYWAKKIGLRIGDEEVYSFMDMFWISWPRIVFGFDDIERVDSQILQNLMGVLNEYVEHRDCHVILVSNERNIGKDSGDNKRNYNTKKEKLIRFTIAYPQNKEEINNLRKKVFGDYIEEYRLKEQKIWQDIVYKELDKVYIYLENGNIRTLLYNLDVIKRLSQQLSKYMDNNDKVVRYIIKIASIYSIAICTNKDYLTQIRKHLFQRYNGIILDDAEIQPLVNKEEEENGGEATSIDKIYENLKERIMSLLQNDQEYGNDQAIYDYMMSGVFDEKKFNKDLHAIASIIVGKELTEGEKILQLFRNYLSCSDEELGGTVDKAITMVSDKEVDPIACLKIYIFISEFVEKKVIILDTAVEDLYKMFEKSIDDTLRKYDENINNELNTLSISMRRDDKWKIKDLAEVIKKKNESLKTNESKQKFLSYIYTPKKWKNYDGFISDEHPLLSYVDIIKFVDLLKDDNTENKEVRNFLVFLNLRCSGDNMKKEEEGFCKALAQECLEYSEKLEKGIRKELLNRIGTKAANCTQ